MVTIPASVPVPCPVSGTGVPAFSRIATTIVITISTMMKRERLRSIPGIVDGKERKEKRVVVEAGYFKVQQGNVLVLIIRFPVTENYIINLKLT